MTTQQIRFDDGAAYERYMGVWSQLAGNAFLDWLAPPRGLRWLDVGCGNGAFTELLIERCRAASVYGLDPSEAQLSYARTRLGARAHFDPGDAMALPYPDNAFDAAVMPLSIFFVPDPATGVAEMARVVGPGGLIAAYGWDMAGGGFPYALLRTEMGNLGLAVPQPPSPDASGTEKLQDLWAGAGLEAIDTTAITVQRTFADFDDYWATVLRAPSTGGTMSAMPPGDLSRLRATMRQHLGADAGRPVAYSARANAVRGRVRH
jgi:SAM-dependent methyltransferase